MPTDIRVLADQFLTAFPNINTLIEHSSCLREELSQEVGGTDRPRSVLVLEVTKKSVLVLVSIEPLLRPSQE